MNSKRKGSRRPDLRHVVDLQGNHWTVCNNHYMEKLIKGKISQQTLPGDAVGKFCECCEALSLFDG